MNPEGLAVHEQGQNSIRDAADAGLNDGAVFDQAGDVPGNGGLHVGNFRSLHGAERTRGFDDGVDLAHMDEAVAVGARHLVVYLRDHIAGQARGGQGGVDADPEAAETVRVGRRDLNERNVDRHRAALE